MAFIIALVVQQDYMIPVNSDGTYGYTVQIPTPLSGGKIDCDYWAVPINGQGFVSDGYKFIPCQPADTIKPDVQAFHVVRILSATQSTDWYVLGTSTQYNNVSYDAETGHTGTPIMPVFTQAILPSQIICNMSKLGFYTATLGAPTLLTGQKYYAAGFFNAAALTALSATGYTTMALLIAAMNTNWSIAGVWSASADGITVILTQAVAAVGTDVIAAAVTAA